MEPKSLKVAMFIVGLAAATEVRAQERAAFEELGQTVKPGQALVLKDSEGKRFPAGSITRISRPAFAIASTNEWNPDVGAPGAFMSRKGILATVRF